MVEQQGSNRTIGSGSLGTTFQLAAKPQTTKICDRPVSQAIS